MDFSSGAQAVNATVAALAILLITIESAAWRSYRMYMTSIEKSSRIAPPGLGSASLPRPRDSFEGVRLNGRRSRQYSMPAGDSSTDSPAQSVLRKWLSESPRLSNIWRSVTRIPDHELIDLWELKEALKSCLGYRPFIVKVSSYNVAGKSRSSRLVQSLLLTHVQILGDMVFLEYYKGKSQDSFGSTLPSLEDITRCITAKTLVPRRIIEENALLQAFLGDVHAHLPARRAEIAEPMFSDITTVRLKDLRPRYKDTQFSLTKRHKSTKHLMYNDLATHNADHYFYSDRMEIFRRCSIFTSLLTPINESAHGRKVSQYS